jgi:hypothetical protein
MARGSTRIAVVQVWFTGGQHRDYVIRRKAATGGSVGSRPPIVASKSLALPGRRGEFDLRNVANARALEAAFKAVETQELAA